MEDDKHDDTGVSLSVGPDHVKVKVSDRTLGRVGAAAMWLFPKKAAKTKITAAIASRVAEKIKSGNQLDQQEWDFVGLVYEKEARALANREAVAYRVHEVLPEVTSRMQELPQASQESISETFIARAETIASEATEEQIREIFARVLAEEIARPGSISLRTLETVRMLDQGLASTFDKARRLAFGNQVILLEGEIGEMVINRGLGWGAFLELQDAGLIDPGFSQLPMTFGNKDEETIWGYQDRILRMSMRDIGTICSRPTPARRLTRTGREIASVLPLAPDEEYFTKCRAWLSLILGQCATVDWRYVSDARWQTK